MENKRDPFLRFGVGCIFIGIWMMHQGYCEESFSDEEIIHIAAAALFIHVLMTLIWVYQWKNLLQFLLWSLLWVLLDKQGYLVRKQKSLYVYQIDISLVVDLVYTFVVVSGMSRFCRNIAKLIL